MTYSSNHDHSQISRNCCFHFRDNQQFSYKIYKIRLKNKPIFEKNTTINVINFPSRLRFRNFLIYLTDHQFDGWSTMRNHHFVHFLEMELYFLLFQLFHFSVVRFGLFYDSNRYFVIFELKNTLCRLLVTDFRSKKFRFGISILENPRTPSFIKIERKKFSTNQNAASSISLHHPLVTEIRSEKFKFGISILENLYTLSFSENGRKTFSANQNAALEFRNQFL